MGQNQYNEIELLKKKTDEILDKLNGSLDVFIQDQTTPAFEHWLSYPVQAVVLQSNLILDQYSIDVDTVGTLNPATDGGNGYFLEIRYVDVSSGLIRFYQEEINTITDNGTYFTLEMAVPIDFDLIVANIESSYISDVNSARLSATALPTNKIVMFTTPPDGVDWDITRMMITGIMSGAPDDSKFCDQPILTWGIYFGTETGVNLHRHIINIKANASFRASAYDVNYTERTVPQGSHGISVRKSFGGQDKYGVVFRLEGETNDKFFVVLQDDYSDVTQLRFKIMGHLVQD